MCMVFIAGFSRLRSAETIAQLPAATAAAADVSSRQSRVPGWVGASVNQRQGVTAGTVDYSEDFESYR